MDVYAHTTSGDERTWEPLEEHLRAVADGIGGSGGAAEFGAAFGAGEIARVAGLWHDVGKYAPEFQRYLRESHAGKVGRGGVDHSTAGAVHAIERFKNGLGLALAFAIAGHHAGLADLETEEESSLKRRLANKAAEVREALMTAPASLLGVAQLAAPGWLGGSEQLNPLRVSMFIRMLFSCLVDADRLATERFADRARAEKRRDKAPGIPALRAALDAYVDGLAAGATGLSEAVRAQRAELLGACRERAALEPGLFSLTAPTGSGKTLSSMAFALRHAEKYGLRRVIYALPYTSVTEQNAAVFKRAFGVCGERAVLEHHSAYRPGTPDEEHPTEVWRRLAVENWDAPVVVTTNVQLLESLFASNPSDCRKLHRIARSVVVLDEAQSLPVRLLKPTLAALDELAKAYGVSVVLCSATMPAVTVRDGFPIGLAGVREIVPEPERMAVAMRRAVVERAGMLDDEAVVERVCAAGRVLAIVNTRRHAARLYEMVRTRSEGALHLSALMCPAHRSERVKEIKRRLEGGEPCRVVSTQVVEAGVDIDFPLVLRAMAGLDSIVQSAGRCNRGGRMASGRVVVFDTDEKPPPDIGRAAGDTSQVLEPGVDALDLATIERYFGLHYWRRSGEWDGGVGGDGRSRRLTEALSSRLLKFREAAEMYRIIDDWAISVVVPHGGEGRAVCASLVGGALNDRSVLRSAQRYTVSVTPYVADGLLSRGVGTLAAAGMIVLEDASAYDEEVGLRIDAMRAPEGLIS